MSAPIPETTAQVRNKIEVIMKGLLGTDQPLDHESSFFQLGGTSLSAARLAARIGTAYDLRVSLRTIYAKQTIASIAEAVEHDLDREIADLSDDEVAVLSSDGRFTGGGQT